MQHDMERNQLFATHLVLGSLEPRVVAKVNLSPSKSTRMHITRSSLKKMQCGFVGLLRTQMVPQTSQVMVTSAQCFAQMVMYLQNRVVQTFCVMQTCVRGFQKG